MGTDVGRKSQGEEGKRVSGEKGEIKELSFCLFAFFSSVEQEFDLPMLGLFGDLEALFEFLRRELMSGHLLQVDFAGSD
jgi:hypothetical protein